MVSVSAAGMTEPAAHQSRPLQSSAAVDVDRVLGSATQPFSGSASAERLGGSLQSGCSLITALAIQNLPVLPAGLT